MPESAALLLSSAKPALPERVLVQGASPVPAGLPSLGRRRHDPETGARGWGRVTASAGAERQKPVLSLGRDGIALGVRIKGGSVFEVVTTATVSVPAGQCLVRRPRR